ncbi:MAG: 16S rRNA (cytosine(1402)-N(4))-methyltransferase RsmH [Myxococcota bacterium]
MFSHIPVMPTEVLEALALAPGMIVADVTAGGGGHLRLLAEAVGPNGQVIALDKDPRAHELDAAGGVAKEFPQVKLVRATFSELPQVLSDLGLTHLDGLLADIGVSSPQLDTPERGLSFKNDGPLDMRMNPDADLSALELIQSSSETTLANLIYEFGEERQSRPIARAIKAEKNLADSTTALAAIIARAYRGPRGKIHPATRTFQALRIAVNHELDELKALLSNLTSVIKPDGKAAIISFHSLEDRLVKNFFKENRESWLALTKKPVIPSDAEMSQNPRARSAKLRTAQRVNQ